MKAAVQELIREARKRDEAGRNRESLRVAQQAVEAAQRVGLVGLELVAMSWEATAMKMLGDTETALTRYSRIITAAHDVTLGDVRSREDVVRIIVDAYMNFVDCGRFLPRMDRAQLLKVLDRGEVYLRAIGRSAWRAGFCLQRAKVLGELGRVEDAVGYAEEALALKERHPHAPGYMLAAHRLTLGGMLQGVGRHEEAKHCCEQVLQEQGAEIHIRPMALVGLARSALETQDPASAHQHVRQAVQEAQANDLTLCVALGVFIDVCLARSDYEAAWGAAQRFLELARRLECSHRMYYAIRCAAKVALARRDAPIVRAQLEELRPLAGLMDRSTGRMVHTDECEGLQEQLVELEGSRS